MLALTQLVYQALSATDFISALAEMITNVVTYLAEWIVGLLTGGSPISLLVVLTLIVVILGKLRGDDRY